MSAKHLASLVVVAATAVMVLGTVSAGAAGQVRVLRFHDGPGLASSVGFDSNSDVPPPVGSRLVLTLPLYNQGPQFGKPSGTRIGRVLIDCTFLSDAGDGLCTAIAHVPDGYFLFGGTGALTGAKIAHWAILGGVGPYANDRGEIKVTNLANGSSNAIVTLTT